jgi:nitrite reductase/ring-hydroxylating ferredoxin subunit
LKKDIHIQKCKIFFELKIEDINPNSNMKIKVKCDICRNEKYLSLHEYNNSINNGGYYACSAKCSHEKVKQTCLKNNGVEYPLPIRYNKGKN